MANEIQVASNISGLSVYALRVSAAGLYYHAVNGWEAYQVGHLSGYAVTLTEQSSSRRYFGDLGISQDRPITIFAYSRTTVGQVHEDTDLLIYVQELPFTPPNTGTGARTVNVTVTDGTDPLESATVRLTKGAESYAAATDVDGLAVFNIDDGTWVVGITLSGYSFDGDSLVVTDDDDVTYEMSAVTIPPSSPGQTTGVMYTYDEEGVIEAAVPVQMVATKVPSTVTGIALDGAVRTEVSGSDGLVTFPNLFKGVTYTVTRGGGVPVKVTVPTTAGDTWEMTGVIGEDE